MEEKKLTDEEIVKALEHCSNNRSCEYCYHNDEVGSGEIVCRGRLMQKGLDLIHRLQGENKELRTESDIMVAEHLAFVKLAKKADEQQKAEIEKLKCNTKLDSWKNKFLNALKENAEQKAEIERLTEEKTCVYQEYNDGDWSYWECSNCEEPFCFNNECSPEENQYHYCPNCGARITEHKELQNG